MEITSPFGEKPKERAVDQMPKVGGPLERGIFGRKGRKEEYLKPYDNEDFNQLLDNYSPRAIDEKSGVLVNEADIESVSASVKQVVKGEGLVVEQRLSTDGSAVNRPQDQIRIIAELGRALKEYNGGSSTVKFRMTGSIPVGWSEYTISGEVSVSGDAKYAEVRFEPKQADRFLVTAVQTRKGKKVDHSVTHLVEAPQGEARAAFDGLMFDLENTGNFTFKPLDTLGTVIISYTAVDSGLRTRGEAKMELKWKARGDWALVGSGKEADLTKTAYMKRQFENDGAGWIFQEAGRILDACGAKELTKILASGN
ncbi:MAG: hypothetical protein ABIE03_03465 [Patescibacteria group bacterium]|nr:hypothetical protein [Patescibacteria group bacterium]